MKSITTKVCLVFDDGFVRSSNRTAEIFEARNLKATFAVLVDHEGFMPEFPKGDFSLWNALQDRGHIIHPHGYDHTDLIKIPYEEAKNKIDACLDYFAANLNGFDASKSIYHLTYNRSTSEVDNYLLSKFRAIRSMGPKGDAGSGMNNKYELDRRIFNCAWHGPEHCDAHLMATLKIAEIEKPELLMYMLHGLDDEGWGPIHEEALKNALDYIIKSPVLQLMH